MRLIPRTLNQIDSPIRATYALLDRRAGDRELLDLAQAAPAFPPAPEVTEHLAKVVSEPLSNQYAEIAGLRKLREAFAADLAEAYRAPSLDAGDIVITAGCNQAFCVTVSALAAPGDEVIVVLPYYFNHHMWLRLDGLVPVYLEPGPGLIPRVEDARGLISGRTRAILLVTPNNPCGVTIPPDVIAGFAELAAERGIALILDETYRTFRGTAEPPHRLFTDPGWGEHVVSLHSFSKELALPGYRVGAVVASPRLNREVMKLLDCVAICAPRLGQEAAWAGLAQASQWRRERARELAAKQRDFEAAMASRPGGFELVTCGAYFGWIRHPFADRPTADVVHQLVMRLDTLVIGGTAFLPEDRGMLRASFANLAPAAIDDFAQRLSLVD